MPDGVGAPVTVRLYVCVSISGIPMMTHGDKWQWANAGQKWKAHRGEESQRQIALIASVRRKMDIKESSPHHYAFKCARVGAFKETTEEGRQGTEWRAERRYKTSKVSRNES